MIASLVYGFIVNIHDYIKLKQEYYKKILQELKEYTPELVSDELLKQIDDDYLIIKYEGQ